MIIAACGFAFLVAIGILAFALAGKAKGDAWEQQAEDEGQMMALLEHQLAAGLEDELFA